MTKLYTDTSANLPLALLREYDIAVIPFSYTVNGVGVATQRFDGYTGMQMNIVFLPPVSG